MRTHLKDYFIPHAGNDYRPHSLQRTAVVGMIGMVVVSFLAVSLQAFTWIDSDWLRAAVLPGVIVDLTNEERADDALGGLRHSALLDVAAQKKAEDMARYSYFAHESPEGVTPWHWFDVAGYRYVHAGENLAVHFKDSGEVVDAWMRSPTHRANILDGRYTEIGVGTAKGVYEGYDTVFVVQLFGTPAIAPLVTETSAQVPAESESVSVAAAEAPVSAATEAVLAESVSVLERPVQASGTRPDSGVAEPEVVAADVFSEESTADAMRTMSFMADTDETAVAAFVAPAEETVRSSWWQRLVTQPQQVLQLVYLVLGGFVLVCLLAAVFIEIRRQEPLQVAYALLLMVLMVGLYQAHMYLTSGALVV